MTKHLTDIKSRFFKSIFISIFNLSELILVIIAEGVHLFSYRIQKLSLPAPMVLPGYPGGRVGRGQVQSR